MLDSDGKRIELLWKCVKLIVQHLERHAVVTRIWVTSATQSLDP